MVAKEIINKIRAYCWVKAVLFIAFIRSCLEKLPPRQEIIEKMKSCGRSALLRRPSVHMIGAAVFLAIVILLLPGQKPPPLEEPAAAPEIQAPPEIPPPLAEIPPPLEKPNPPAFDLSALRLPPSEIADITLGLQEKGALVLEQTKPGVWKISNRSKRDTVDARAPLGAITRILQDFQPVEIKPLNQIKPSDKARKKAQITLYGDVALILTLAEENQNTWLHVWARPLTAKGNARAEEFNKKFKTSAFLLNEETAALLNLRMSDVVMPRGGKTRKKN